MLKIVVFKICLFAFHTACTIKAYHFFSISCTTLTIDYNWSLL